jgi:hypothetical protein
MLLLVIHAASPSDRSSKNTRNVAKRAQLHSEKAELRKHGVLNVKSAASFFRSIAGLIILRSSILDDNQ